MDRKAESHRLAEYAKAVLQHQVRLGGAANTLSADVTRAGALKGDSRDDYDVPDLTTDLAYALTNYGDELAMSEYHLAEDRARIWGIDDASEDVADAAMYARVLAYLDGGARRDLILLGLGIAATTAASIWSVFLGD